MIRELIRFAENRNRRQAVPAPPRICFVAPNAYGMLSPRSELRHIGGAETQLGLISAEFVARGYPIRFVTWDHGQPDGVEHNGVRVFKTCRADAGIRGLRFLHPRASALWRAMRRADADIYYQRTSDALTGIVAAFCRRHHRRFAFGVAAVEDCLPELPHCATLRERMLYRYGLRRADVVVAQTRLQQQLLEENFGVASVLIASLAPRQMTPTRVAKTPKPSRTGRCLWVGALLPHKRLELLLDVAEGCPEIAFDVVGDGDHGDPYVYRLLSHAARLRNVHLRGWVPYREIGRLYAQTSLLLCTSPLEGFPNTFLEAWGVGVPVVTTFDPDGIVAANRLGGVARDVPALVNAIRRLLTSGASWRHVSRNVRRYVREHHGAAHVLPKYEQLFLSLLTGSLHR